MSLWVEKKRRDDSRGIEITTFPFAELLLPAMILIGLMATIGRGGAVLLTCLGCFLLVISKISVFRKGVFTSWGSKVVSPSFRACYRVGYAFMLLGLLAGIFSVKLGR